MGLRCPFPIEQKGKGSKWALTRWLAAIGQVKAFDISHTFLRGPWHPFSRGASSTSYRGPWLQVSCAQHVSCRPLRGSLLWFSCSLPECCITAKSELMSICNEFHHREWTNRPFFIRVRPYRGLWEMFHPSGMQRGYPFVKVHGWTKATCRTQCSFLVVFSIEFL